MSPTYRFSQRLFLEFYAFFELAPEVLITVP